jgi:hypothetical protein
MKYPSYEFYQPVDLERDQNKSLLAKLTAHVMTAQIAALHALAGMQCAERFVS